MGDLDRETEGSCSRLFVATPVRGWIPGLKMA